MILYVLTGWLADWLRDKDHADGMPILRVETRLGCRRGLGSAGVTRWWDLPAEQIRELVPELKATPSVKMLDNRRTRCLA